jgi:Rod binding domain-containing protein
VGIGGVQLGSTLAANGSPQQHRQALQQAVQEVVGSVFFAPMLKMARENPLKGKYMHGGRGEDIFGAQLDMELARRASHRVQGGLTDALVKRFDRTSASTVVPKE